jgi:tetratricopeptide (TPR) repeat protein
LQIKPEYAEALNNLGDALLRAGRVDEAVLQDEKALRVKPEYADAHYNLGNALLEKGDLRKAIAEFQKALQFRPDAVEMLNQLAWVLATGSQASLRDGAKALSLARRANKLSGGGNPAILGGMAAAFAETGHFPEALETAKRALQLAETQSNERLADTLRSQIKLYQSGVPFHVP